MEARVSDRTRRIRDDKLRLDAYVDRSGGPDACHPWTGFVNENGYGHIRYKGERTKAHIAAWVEVNGPVRPGMHLDHECHNKAVAAGTCQPGVCAHRRCCNERHIKPKTPKEHKDDSPYYPRPRGSAAGRALLSEELVREIRVCIVRKEFHREIAARFNVSRATITAINARRIWGWLD
jgi:hypothetical protein